VTNEYHRNIAKTRESIRFSEKEPRSFVSIYFLSSRLPRPGRTRGCEKFTISLPKVAGKN